MNDLYGYSETSLSATSASGIFIKTTTEVSASARADLTKSKEVTISNEQNDLSLPTSATESTDTPYDRPKIVKVRTLILYKKEVIT